MPLFIARRSAERPREGTIQESTFPWKKDRTHNTWHLSKNVNTVFKAELQEAREKNLIGLKCGNMTNSPVLCDKWPRVPGGGVPCLLPSQVEYLELYLIFTCSFWREHLFWHGNSWNSPSVLKHFIWRSSFNSFTCFHVLISPLISVKSERKCRSCEERAVLVIAPFFFF